MNCCNDPEHDQEACFRRAVEKRFDTLEDKIDRCIEMLKVQVKLNKQLIKDLHDLEEKVARLEKKL